MSSHDDICTRAQRVASGYTELRTVLLISGNAHYIRRYLEDHQRSGHDKTNPQFSMIVLELTYQCIWCLLYPFVDNAFSLDQCLFTVEVTGTLAWRFFPWSLDCNLQNDLWTWKYTRRDVSSFIRHDLFEETSCVCPSSICPARRLAPEFGCSDSSAWFAQPRVIFMILRLWMQTCWKQALRDWFGWLSSKSAARLKPDNKLYLWFGCIVVVLQKSVRELCIAFVTCSRQHSWAQRSTNIDSSVCTKRIYPQILTLTAIAWQGRRKYGASTASQCSFLTNRNSIQHLQRLEHY